MISENRRNRNAENIGSSIKVAREKSGFTQKALADTIGLEYYTMISQIELGYISVPPTLWIPIANALGLNRSHFVLSCIATYQPEVYAALFDSRGRGDVTLFLDAFVKGQLSLPKQSTEHL